VPKSFGNNKFLFPDGSVVVENSLYSLVFDEDTRLLATITHKPSGKTENIQV